jgi:hypothetical protein
MPSEVTQGPHHFQVTLNCTGEDPENFQKRVQVIKNCSCSTCDAGDDLAAVSSLSASGDGEIGTDHKASLPDVGDLIDFMLKTQSKGPAAGPTGRDPVQCPVFIALEPHTSVHYTKFHQRIGDKYITCPYLDYIHVLTSSFMCFHYEIKYISCGLHSVEVTLIMAVYISETNFATTRSIL